MIARRRKRAAMTAVCQVSEDDQLAKRHVPASAEKEEAFFRGRGARLLFRSVYIYLVTGKTRARRVTALGKHMLGRARATSRRGQHAAGQHRELLSS